jgi:uncharacterized protein YfaS (alpha-2-macroglobulin family)
LLGRCDEKLRADTPETAPPPRVVAFTDKRVYRVGDVAHVVVIARERQEDDYAPLSATFPAVRLKESWGADAASVEVATFSRFGVATFDHVVDEKPSSGDHSLSLDVSGEPFIVRFRVVPAATKPAPTGPVISGWGPPGAWTLRDWRRRPEPVGTLTVDRDKPTYGLGDVAHLTFHSGFERGYGTLLVTHQRELVRRAFTIQAHSGTVDLPIADRWAPGVALTAVVFASAPADAGQYEKVHAYPEISLDVRRLKVLVTPSTTSAKPGETVSVDIETRTPAGVPVPANVVLTVLDDETRVASELPRVDPLVLLYQPASVPPGIASTLTPVVRPEPPAENAGRVERREERQPRTFATTATLRPPVLFQPLLETDETGHAHASWVMPAGVSGCRITAVANDDARLFGSAEIDVRALAPAHE